MPTFYEDGTRLKPTDGVHIGCYETCGVGGCQVVVSRCVAHPCGHAGHLTFEDTAAARTDFPTFSLRCSEHVRHNPAERQLDLFEEAS